MDQYGHCWIAPNRQTWITFYPETGVRKAFYQAYRAIHPVPAEREPWSIDNRRIGDEFGFKTLEAAKAAAEAA